MITLINNKQALEKLTHGDIYEGKIKTLERAYGFSQNFCAFYQQADSLLLSRLDGDFVIKVLEEDYDVQELALFLKAHNAKNLFLPPKLLQELELFIENAQLRYCGILEYEGKHIPQKISDSPDLTAVFDILKQDFNIEYSSWLTDVSHRVRHGISTVYLYNNASTVTALYDADSHVFLTQVGTAPQERGRGLAAAMLKEVAGRYKKSGKTVSLVSRYSLMPFYEKVGFKKVGTAAIAFL
ncbi:MAG: GNAT family N-acetyltransferase [Oscillospiraceae bacterium]|nr:GNAT family N-acetyltransferase [Oscillospiraceae bacterium]